MGLKGKEKYFWERNFGIKNQNDIPASLEGITGIDSAHDDTFFEFLTARVSSIAEIHLRCTDITDETVRLISRLSGVRQLTIKDHRHVTSACLPYLNKLTELEYLDISKNTLPAEDLYALTELRHLKQLFISTDRPVADFAGELEKLQQHFPGCEITVY